MKRHLADWLDLKLGDITTNMVVDRHEKIGERAGPGAANSAMYALRLLWNFAAERDPTLPAHPERVLKRSWYDLTPRRRMVPQDKLAAFYAAVSRLPNVVARDYLLLFTGLRRREAASLKWSDVDFRARVIRIRETKAGRPFDLPMSSFVHRLLVAMRSRGAEFVFPSHSRSGHITEPKGFLKRVKEACGVEVSVHDLRRTFATVVAEMEDASPLAIKALLNHSLGGDVTSG